MRAFLMTGWALDLGTTNTALARWDDAAGQPRLVELPAVCRNPKGSDPFEAPRLVPSAIDFLDRPGIVDRVGAWPPLERLALVGRTALIGRPALVRNQGSHLLENVWVEATFYNVARQVMDTQAVRIGSVSPGSVRAFRIEAESYDNLYNIDSYELRPTWDE